MRAAAAVTVTAHNVPDRLVGHLDRYLVRIDARTWMGTCSARVRLALIHAVSDVCAQEAGSRATIAWQDVGAPLGVSVVHLGAASDTVDLDGIPVAYTPRR